MISFRKTKTKADFYKKKNSKPSKNQNKSESPRKKAHLLKESGLVIRQFDFTPSFIHRANIFPEIYENFVHHKLYQRKPTNPLPAKKSRTPNARETTPKRAITNHSNLTLKSQLKRDKPQQKAETIPRPLALKLKQPKIGKVVSSSLKHALNPESERPVQEISSRRKGFINKINIDKNDPKVASTFSAMTKDSFKLSQKLFVEYLNKRYSKEMVEVMSKIIPSRQELGLEQFINEIDKMFFGTRERQLKFVFELFDFNRDKYLCYEDCFKALIERTTNIYDQDVKNIHSLLGSKELGNIKSSATLKTIATKVSKGVIKKPHSEEFNKFKVPSSNLQKPEAINLEEFVQYGFKDKRPQILQDLYWYLTGVEEPREESPSTSRVSEDLVIDMNIFPELKEEVLQTKDHSYFLELQNILLNYEKWEVELLLEKFSMMRCPKFKKAKLLSLNSVVSNFHKVFGVKCDYVAENFYYLLAGPKHTNVNKAAFLAKLFPLLKVSFT